MSPFGPLQRIDTADTASPGRRTPLSGSHVVTIYNALGEVERRATYSRTVLEGVRVERRSGAVAGLAGQTATDGLLVFVPGTAAGFVEPEMFAGEGWTLREGDLIVVGDCDLDIPPNRVAELEATREVYRIKGFETHDGRHGGVHHREVAAA